MTFCPILASHFHPITTCRLLTFLRGDRVVVTDQSTPDVEMCPTEANRTEYTMKLLLQTGIASEDDLTYNNVRSDPLPPRLREFQSTA
jgi:hypothetical protein